MIGFLFRLLITALGLYAASAIVSGFHIEGTGNLIVAALLLGVVNAIVRPLILILTLPLTLVTLGLFLLVVNGISVALVAWLMPGVTVAGIWSATLAALIVGLTGWFASMFVGSSGKLERFRVETTGRTLP
jgi:putative membrane protein